MQDTRRREQELKTHKRAHGSRHTHKRERERARAQGTKKKHTHRARDKETHEPSKRSACCVLLGGAVEVVRAHLPREFPMSKKNASKEKRESRYRAARRHVDHVAENLHGPEHEEDHLRGQRCKAKKQTGKKKNNNKKIKESIKRGDKDMKTLNGPRSTARGRAVVVRLAVAVPVVQESEHGKAPDGPVRQLGSQDEKQNEVGEREEKKNTTKRGKNTHMKRDWERPAGQGPRSSSPPRRDTCR